MTRIKAKPKQKAAVGAMSTQDHPPPKPAKKGKR